MSGRHHPSQNTHGALLLPMIFTLLLCALLGGGTVALMVRWNNLVKIQVTLNDCVEKGARDLSGLLNDIVDSNSRIRVLRVAAAASTGFPPARAVTAASLVIEGIFQIERRAKWMLLQAQWMSSNVGLRKCGWTSGWPVYPWIHLPPDTLGPRPLKWSGGSQRFQLLARQSPRLAGAEISPKKEGDINAIFSPPTWIARWNRKISR